MPTLILPDPKIKSWSIRQDNEVSSILYRTFQVDLERNPGHIRLSNRSILHSSGVSNFGLTTAVTRSNADATDRWWFLSNSRLFVTAGTSPVAALTADALANSPTTCDGDMINFFEANGEDRLVVPLSTDVAILNRSGSANAWTTNWWTSTLGAAALSDVDHPVDVFQNLLLVGDIDSNLRGVIHIVDESDIEVVSRLVFPKGLYPTWIRHTADRVYIGTRVVVSDTETARNREAFIFEWDGVEPNYNRYFKIGSGAFSTPSGCVLNNIPFVLTNKGEILQFNGQGFEMLNQLPILNDPYDHTYLLVDDSPWGIHRNGMISMDDGIALLIRGNESLDRLPGGIWFLNLKRNELYHRWSVGQNTSANSNTDYGQHLLSQVGVLQPTSRERGYFAVGVLHYDTQSATIAATHRMDTTSSNAGARGNIVTIKIPAQGFIAKWRRLKLLFKEFENSTDRIIVKYRTQEREATPTAVDLYTGTWTSTTTFTATLATNVAVGNEVEVLYGDGAGSTTHISTLSATPDGSTSITVTIDEAVDVASGTMRCRIENWTKLGTISDSSIDQQLYSIIQQAKWIQLKIELRGTDQSPELEGLMLEFTNYTR